MFRLSILATGYSILCRYFVNTNDHYLDLGKLMRGQEMPVAPVINLYHTVIMYVDYFLENRFYPADVYEKISNVKYMEDCSVICRMEKRCRTFTYHPTLRVCFMFEVDKFTGVKLFTGLANVLSVPSDYKNVTGGSKSIPPMLPGVASGVCGMPFYQSHHVQPRAKRVLNGETAPYYSVPWMVQLVIEDRRICSGSLISATQYLLEFQTKFILTSASCIAASLLGQQIIANKISARAGFHDMRFTQPHEQSRDCCGFYAPHWSRFTPENDVVILLACDYFRFNKYVRPVCIPEENETEVARDARCYVAGWGVSAVEVAAPSGMLRNYMYPQVLKRAEVSIVRDSQHYPRIYSLLAKNDERGGIASTGDYGGPFFCRNSHNMFTLHGVINQAVFLAEKEVPEFANTCVNVARFRQWIVNVTSSGSTRGSAPESQLSKKFPILAGLLQAKP